MQAKYAQKVAGCRGDDAAGTKVISQQAARWLVPIADQMGLFGSMAGPIERPDLQPSAYDLPRTGELVPLSVELDGKTVSRRDLLREVRTMDVAGHQLTLRDTGFIGTYFAQRSLPTRKTAVLLFGGSGGGQTKDLEASLLASHGYPALSIAYFGAPGSSAMAGRHSARVLRQGAQLAPCAALRMADPQRVLVFGVSRGSEAAQLLGVYEANLVHSVIAIVPSNVAICAYPGCGGPAWTLGGNALPHTKQFDEPAPTDDSAAVIPMERIQGPIFSRLWR
jgi:hypothetical protein